MNAYILSTGDELVRGRTLDTNTSAIARELATVGVSAVGASVVGDDLDLLVHAIRRAASVAEVVILSGGLGPTEDDCTRRAVALAAGVPLVRVPALELALRARFAARATPMPDSNLLQADQPQGAETLPNPNGTAPGFVATVGAARVFAIPGPPHEMRAMLETEVLPRVRALGGPATGVVCTRSLETFGEREAAVGELIADLMRRGRQPRVGTTASRGTIRIILHDEGAPEDVARRLTADEAEIRRRLPAIVFGVDGETLPEVVGPQLLASGLTIAVAESCTGGLVGGALTETPGISRSFLGGVISYDDTVKVRELGVPTETLAKFGAVSEETARAMATGVRAKFGADLGLAITGIAGPGGGSESKPVGLVHFALDDRGVVHSKRGIFPGGRSLVRDIAVKSALDLVRVSLAR